MKPTKTWYSTEGDAIKAGKSSNWTKARGGFAVVEVRVGDTYKYDYAISGTPVEHGYIIAKYRFVNSWRKIA